MIHFFTHINNIVGLSICLLAIIGDKLTSKIEIFIIRAFCDNITHMLIAGLSWLIVVRNMKYTHSLQYFQVILCALIGSFIDLDHFLVAKTIHYQEIQNNIRRGIFHITTIPIVISLFMLVWAQKFVSDSINIFAWIILTAFLSHHIRDATRRGFLLTPFGSTQPVPYFYYILLIFILPFLISYGEYLTTRLISKNKSLIQINQPLVMDFEV